MHRSIVFTALIHLTLACLIYGQEVIKPPVDQEQKEPTLEETTKWLSQNLPALAAYEGRYKNLPRSQFKDADKTSIKVLSAAIDGCNCEISIERHSFASLEQEKFLFSLSNLDQSKVETLLIGEGLMDPPEPTIRMWTKEEKKSIRRSSYNKTALLSPSSYTYNTNQISIGTDSKESAERLAKAFRHAIKLCQNSKKEPF